MATTLDELAELLRTGPVGWEVDQRPHVEHVTVDAIRAFALGTGDDNPRYVGPHADPGHVEAPPLFLLATGSTPVEPPRLLPAALGAALRTRVRIDAEHWAFPGVARAGDRLVRVDLLTAVRPIDPPDVYDVAQVTTWRRGDTIVGVRERTRRHGVVAEPPPRRARARYTDEQLAAIEHAALAEHRRGAATRTVAEVRAGQALPRVVRGPLTTTDLISYRAAVGPGPLDAGAGPIRHRNRRAAPELFSRDGSGAWDTIERLHWDDAYAQERGHPAAYDYSHMRAVWLAAWLTDWAGDGARLQELAVRVLAPNYVGDTQWLSGTVTRVQATPTGGTAALSVACHDQDSSCTATGTALVHLPATP